MNDNGILILPWEQMSKENLEFPKEQCFFLFWKPCPRSRRKGLYSVPHHIGLAWLLPHHLVLPLIRRSPNLRSIVPLDPKPVTRPGTIMGNIRRRPATSLLGSLCIEYTLQAPTSKSFKSWLCTGGKLLHEVISKHRFPCWVHSTLLGTMRRHTKNKVMTLPLSGRCELFQGHQEPLTRELTLPGEYFQLG